MDWKKQYGSKRSVCTYINEHFWKPYWKFYEVQKQYVYKTSIHKQNIIVNMWSSYYHVKWYNIDHLNKEEDLEEKNKPVSKQCKIGGKIPD